MDSKCVKWFRSYLTHRTQFTTIGEVSSTQRSATVGVPQGAVLGPLLFLVYINDMPECLKHTKASLFGDDTVVYCGPQVSRQKLYKKDVNISFESVTKLSN